LEEGEALFRANEKALDDRANDAANVYDEFVRVVRQKLLV
jgi:hypothetical protein